MQLPFTPGQLRLSQRLLGILPVHSPYADICMAKRQAGSLPLTLFYPKDRGLQGPCLIFYHGGGFGHPAAPQHRRLAAFLARDAFRSAGRFRRENSEAPKMPLGRNTMMIMSRMA